MYTKFKGLTCQIFNFLVFPTLHFSFSRILHFDVIQISVYFLKYFRKYATFFHSFSLDYHVTYAYINRLSFGYPILLKFFRTIIFSINYLFSFSNIYIYIHSTSWRMTYERCIDIGNQIRSNNIR